MGDLRAFSCQSPLTLHTGYDEVAAFRSSQAKYTIPQSRARRSGFDSDAVFGLINLLRCLGGERNIGECLLDVMQTIFSSKFKALPPGSSTTVDNVAWVKCTGTMHNFTLHLLAYWYFKVLECRLFTRQYFADWA